MATGNRAMTDKIGDGVQKSIELMQESFETSRGAETERSNENPAAYELLTVKAYAQHAAALKLAFPDD